MTSLSITGQLQDRLLEASRSLQVKSIGSPVVLNKIKYYNLFVLQSKKYHFDANITILSDYT